MINTSLPENPFPASAKIELEISYWQLTHKFTQFDNQIAAICPYGLY
jgi:hypothetical protein